uniref:Putative head-tail connector n=2 Tax=viral metagenome TaxID=1070528 RepID=A0A6M3KCS9_9ZZZZ
MYGAYCNIADLKGVLGITTTTDDTVMRKIVESASRSIDQYTNRTFIAYTGTKVFNGSRELWIPDLLSISASGLKTDDNDDGTYENTWATTDYIEYGVGIEDTLNTYPRIRLETNPNGDYNSFASGVKKGVQIAGLWGYGDGISATPYVADTTITEDLTSGEAAIDVTAVTNLSAGQVILIGSEQYYIYSIATLTLTVEPTVNGTTAATHSSGATIYIYQYPSDIRQACIALSTALYQLRDKQGLQSERIGDYEYTVRGTAGRGGLMTEIGMIKSILDDTIRSYKRMRF